MKKIFLILTIVGCNFSNKKNITFEDLESKIDNYKFKIKEHELKIKSLSLNIIKPQIGLSSHESSVDCFSEKVKNLKGDISCYNKTLKELSTERDVFLKHMNYMNALSYKKGKKERKMEEVKTKLSSCWFFQKWWFKRKLNILDREIKIITKKIEPIESTSTFEKYKQNEISTKVTLNQIEESKTQLDKIENTKKEIENTKKEIIDDIKECIKDNEDIEKNIDNMKLIELKKLNCVCDIGIFYKKDLIEVLIDDECALLNEYCDFNNVLLEEKARLAASSEKLKDLIGKRLKKIKEEDKELDNQINNIIKEMGDYDDSLLNRNIKRRPISSLEAIKVNLSKEISKFKQKIEEIRKKKSELLGGKSPEKLLPNDTVETFEEYLNGFNKEIKIIDDLIANKKNESDFDKYLDKIIESIEFDRECLQKIKDKPIENFKKIKTGLQKKISKFKKEIGKNHASGNSSKKEFYFNNLVESIERIINKQSN